MHITHTEGEHVLPALPNFMNMIAPVTSAKARAMSWVYESVNILTSVGGRMGFLPVPRRMRSETYMPRAWSCALTNSVRTTRKSVVATKEAT